MAMLNPFSTYVKSLYACKRDGSLLLSGLLLTGCTVGPSSGNTPEEMFEAVLQKPIPASVTQLQGVGDTWQGYQLFLQFQAAHTDIESLIQSGYETVDCAAISTQFRLPDRAYDRFDPPWENLNIAAKDCYSANGLTNSWTGSGSHYLMLDRRNKVVYFAGVGT